MSVMSAAAWWIFWTAVRAAACISPNPASWRRICSIPVICSARNRAKSWALCRTATARPATPPSWPAAWESPRCAIWGRGWPIPLPGTAPSWTPRTAGSRWTLRRSIWRRPAAGWISCAAPGSSPMRWRRLPAAPGTARPSLCWPAPTAPPPRASPLPFRRGFPALGWCAPNPWWWNRSMRPGRLKSTAAACKTPGTSR